MLPSQLRVAVAAATEQQPQQEQQPQRNDAAAGAGVYHHQQLAPVVVPAQGSAGGRAWRVRPYNERTDFWPVAELQARCFHEKVPFAPLDSLAFTVFKAEVVDGLKSKAKCVDPGTYAMLVVEEATEHRDGGSGGGGGGAGAEQRHQQQQNQQQQQQQNQQQEPQQQDGQGPVIGIVELGLQEEGDNVVELQKAGMLRSNRSSSGSGSSSAFDGSSNGSSGSGALPPASSCVYLSSMAVAPTARRSGAARAMLLAAQWQAALWGQQHIALHVFEENAPAVRLYSSAGWVPVCKDPDWKKWLGGKVRSFMVKDLAADQAGGGPVPEEVLQQLREAQRRREQRQQHSSSGAAEQAAPAA